MARKYFGTDGVRGLVGQDPITPEFVLKLAFAAGKALVAREQGHNTISPVQLWQILLPIFHNALPACSGKSAAINSS